MTEIVHFTYESNVPIETSDNYYLQIYAHIEYNGNNSEKLQSTINTSSITFFRTLSLFDAFGLLDDRNREVGKNYKKTVKENCKENQIEVNKFVLTTIDAVRKSGEEDLINFKIHPDLESKKRKKGLFGKLFGNK